MVNAWIGGAMMTGAGYLGQKRAEDVHSGEQSVDPRDWSLDQWKMSALASSLGYLGTAYTVFGYSTRFALRAAAMPYASSAYAGYVVHDTVMNPDSDYYIPPDAPLLGRWQYGSEDVGSRLITALTDDLVGLLT